MRHALIPSLRLHAAGGDGVRPNAVLPEFHGQEPGEMLEARLCGTVGRVAVDAGGIGQEILMMMPLPRAIMPSCTARTQRQAPFRLRSRSANHAASSVNASVGAVTPPALLTRTPIGPKAASARVTASPIEALSVTSAVTHAS